MICQTCQNEAILNQANGKDFYYCRTCKVEVPLEEQKKLPLNDDEWPFWGCHITLDGDVTDFHTAYQDSMDAMVKKFSGNT